MKIQDFCKIRLGHAFRERLVGHPDGEVLVIQPKNILSNGSISFRGDAPLKMGVSTSKFLQPGDVLVVNRGRFAASVFDFSDGKRWITPSSIIVLTINMTSVLPGYLACYLNSAKGQNMFQRHFEQTTISFISGKNLGEMNIPIPSLDRQRAVVAFEQATEKYKQLSWRKQEIYRQFVNHTLIPKENSL